jgi:hypothetical protein
MASAPTITEIEEARVSSGARLNEGGTYGCRLFVLRVPQAQG